MSDPAAVQRDLITLLQKVTVSRQSIGPDTTIYHDLHIVGDDAYEIIKEIVKRYGTSFIGLHLPDYFPDETQALWYFWAAKLGFPDRKRPRLTVGHMVAVIERGQWFAP